MTQHGQPLLELDAVYAAYRSGGDILRGLSLAVWPGELVCLVGPNGAGKSTVLKTIVGLLRARTGAIRLRGESIVGLRPHQLLVKGTSLVPQGRSVFPEMTVWENLQMGGVTMRQGAVLEQRLTELGEMFPLLSQRRGALAGNLSGGEQKVVEMARALVPRPSLLLLDEPTLGLEPRMTGFIFATIRQLHSTGVTVLMVEQNARQALEIVDRAYVLEQGRVALSAPGAELLQSPDIRRLYLGGAATIEA